MITANHRYCIAVTAVSLVLLFTVRSAADNQAALQAKTPDVNVLGTTIRGITLGMSPRRVLVEMQKHNWTYGRSSTDALEDIIAKNPSMTSIYLDLNEPQTPDAGILSTNSLALHFAWDSVSTKQLRVVMLQHSYDVPATRYPALLEAAKEHLTSLGGFKESITEAKQFEHRLTYQKVDRSYIMYQFVRFTKDSQSIMVYYTICSY